MPATSYHVSNTLLFLAEQLSGCTGTRVEPGDARAVVRQIRILARETPGLRPAADTTANVEASRKAFDSARFMDALSHALRGLSIAPHNPALWHLVGLASLECGQPRLAIWALAHARWIEPRYPEFRRAHAKLEGLNPRLDAEIRRAHAL